MIDWPIPSFIGELYTNGSRTWEWNGKAWVGFGPTLQGPIGPTGPQGLIGATGATGMSNFNYPVPNYTNFLIAVNNAALNITAGGFVSGALVEIRSTVTIESLRVRVNTAIGAGNTAVLGIYVYTGTQFNLVQQCPGTINLATIGVQELTFSSPVVVGEGIYCLAIHPSANVSMESYPQVSSQNIFGNAATMGGGASYRNAIAFSTTYTGTLPATIATTAIAPLSLTTNILAKLI